MLKLAQEKSKIMTSIIADVSMNIQKLEEVTSCRYLGAALCRNPYQDCLSNGSSGQTNQDQAVQHHQLHKQVQAVQVSCHLDPPLWL